MPVKHRRPPGLLSLLLAAGRVLEDAGHAGTFAIPTGTFLDLHRDPIIPPDPAGVFVPGTPIGDRYRYAAAGRLEVRTVDATVRTVVADRFTVVRVVRDGERFPQRETGLRRVQLFDRDGPALLRFSTLLYLRSARRPDVFRLVCGHLQDSAQQPRHLTATEIRSVLAPVITWHKASPR